MSDKYIILSVICVIAIIYLVSKCRENFTDPQVKPNVSNVPNYNFIGCYKDNEKEPLVGEYKGIVTLDECKIIANDNKKPIIGFQHSDINMSENYDITKHKGKCYIGDDINKALSLKNTNCNVYTESKYKYNSTINVSVKRTTSANDLGGDNVNSIYTNLDNIIKNKKSFNYIGCYKDDNNNRKILYNNQVKMINNKTIDECAEEASKVDDATLFGLQYSLDNKKGQCWIGNNLAKAIELGNPTDKNQQCQFVNNKYIGKNLTNAIYKLNKPDIISKDGKRYNYVGCFNDNQNIKVNNKIQRLSNKSLYDCANLASENNASIYGFTNPSSNNDTIGTCILGDNNKEATINGLILYNGCKDIDSGQIGLNNNNAIYRLA